MEIDIRDDEEEKVSSIRFSAVAVLTLGTAIVSIGCEQSSSSSAIVRYGDIPNLIKALEKALELSGDDTYLHKNAEDKQHENTTSCFNHKLRGGKVEYYGIHSEEWYPMGEVQNFNLGTRYRIVE